MALSTDMRVSVRLFAAWRESFGSDRIELEFDGDAIALRDLKSAIERLHPDLISLLAATRVAVNQDFASEDASIVRGDDVALIPPVSGGSGAADRAPLF